MFLRSAITSSKACRCATMNARQRVVIARSAAYSTAALPKKLPMFDKSTAALLALSAATASLAITSTTTKNHCQVPCGIFDDHAMVAEVKQAASTIRKAMVQSQTLWSDKESSTKGVQTMNQVVRWINTKEEHCDKIIHVMSDYCLCQRVKREAFSADADYLLALQFHHEVMVAAMKAKQSMDIGACDALDHALSNFEKLY